MPFRRTAASSNVVAAALLTFACAQGASTTGKPAPSDRPERAAEIRLPAEGVTINLDSLRASLDTFYRSELHRHELRALCADRMPAGGCTARVTIQAIGLSKDIRAESGPVRGRVIGQIRNLDSRNLTEMDSLKPASQSSYYVYMDRAANGHARWNLLEVPSTSTGSIRRIVQREVTACNDRPGRVWAHSDVDFANCGEHAFTGMPKTQLLTAIGLIDLVERLERYLRAQGASSRTKWYGCNGGCCV